MDGARASSGSGLPVDRGGRRVRPRRERRYWYALCLVLALAVTGSAQATHVVKRGDSLWRIARKYGTTPGAIVEANGIANPNLIRIGQALAIPRASQPKAPGPSGAVPAGPGWTGSHIIVAGENLTLIAARYKTTVKEMTKVNGITNPSRIRVGKRLVVPAPRLATVEELLAHYAREFGVDPALVKAVAWQESGWKQSVVSSAGAIGVMQLLPETASFASRHLLGSPVDVNDLEHNVRAGVKFLAFLIQKAGGDEKLAVAGYFQGLRSVKTNGVSPKTQRYLNNVTALRKRFS